jgi:hypothetical protein
VGGVIMKLGDGKIEIDEDEGFPYFIIKASNPMGGEMWMWARHFG